SRRRPVGNPPACLQPTRRRGDIVGRVAAKEHAMLAVHAIPVPTARGAWTAWQIDPLIAAMALAAAGGYLAAVARARRHGRDWPGRRTCAFFGLGLGGLVGISVGWPAGYWPAPFSRARRHV